MSALRGGRGRGRKRGSMQGNGWEVWVRKICDCAVMAPKYILSKMIMFLFCVNNYLNIGDLNLLDVIVLLMCEGSWQASTTGI